MNTLLIQIHPLDANFQATLANMVKGKLGGGRVKISDSPFYSQIHEQDLFDNNDCYRPPKRPVKVKTNTPTKKDRRKTQHTEAPELLDVQH